MEMATAVYGNGSICPFIEMVRQTPLPFMQTVNGEGKCSKIIKKNVCHALDTIQ
jgi:hypothetical protein